MSVQSDFGWAAPLRSAAHPKRLTLGVRGNKMKNEDQFNEVFETLKKIADSFEKDSKEYQAIERAAFGLHYINQLRVEDNFLKFVNEMDQPLSEDQISHLQSMGFNPGKYKEP